MRAGPPEGDSGRCRPEPFSKAPKGLRHRDRERPLEGLRLAERDDVDARRKRIRRARHRLYGDGAPAIALAERVAGVAHDVTEVLIEPQRDLGEWTTSRPEPNRGRAVLIADKTGKAVVEDLIIERDAVARRKLRERAIDRDVAGRDAARVER